ncbi:hypothetical protein M8C21_003290 [Ambrosia artemisiifolia]|uniref:Uncharacterized protein n=1 Tax=Ambrosia artemisiifolia TaxID=4212 RepID=A0AAD5BT34_AMBAR|nr:hypothetical protein M8C21_003290 [Ambrosia artemisiifolia]
MVKRMMGFQIYVISMNLMPSVEWMQGLYELCAPNQGRLKYLGIILSNKVMVVLITPVSFPLEIHVLQLMGALYMGNKPVLKVDSKVRIFTGSSRIADKLAYDLNGQIKLEDAGFDRKFMGPDVHEVDHMSWVYDNMNMHVVARNAQTQSLLYINEIICVI